MKEQAKGKRIKPPKLPPTAVGLVPPQGGQTPSFTSRVLCISGAPGSGKSTLALSLAAPWARRSGRKVVIVDIPSRRRSRSRRFDIGAFLGLVPPHPSVLAKIVGMDFSDPKKLPEVHVPVSREGIGALAMPKGMTPAGAAKILTLYQRNYDLFLDLDPDGPLAPVAFAMAQFLCWVILPKTRHIERLSDVAASLGAAFPLLRPDRCRVAVNQVGKKGLLNDRETAALLSNRQFSAPVFLSYQANESQWNALEWIESLRPLLDEIISSLGYDHPIPPASEKASLLVKAGIVSDQQIERAIKLQSQSNLTLEEALVKLGFTTEEAIAMAVSKLLGIPYASKENKILRPEKGQQLEALINERFARDNLVLPLFRDGNVLALAVHDPNPLLLDNLRMMTGCGIQPFIAARTQLLQAMSEFYGSSLAQLDLDKVITEARRAEVVAAFNAILKQAIQERTSSVHMEHEGDKLRIRFRIDGVLQERTPPPSHLSIGMITRIKILARIALGKTLPQTGGFSLKIQGKTLAVEVSSQPTAFGESLVLRLKD